MNSTVMKLFDSGLVNGNSTDVFKSTVKMKLLLNHVDVVELRVQAVFTVEYTTL